MRYLLPILAAFMLLAACEKDNRTQQEKDEDLILEFIKLNDLEAEKHTSGLYYIIDEPGSADHPIVSDSVKMHYYGYLASTGSFFDASKENEPFEWALDELILGWQIGVPLFGRGGKGKLLIPSELGYGARDLGIIPPNSVLVFDIELIDFWH